MSITFVERHALPVVTPLGEAYVVYVKDTGIFGNDEWCCALDDGRILHFTSSQLRSVPNGTYELAMPKAPPVVDGKCAMCGLFTASGHISGCPGGAPEPPRFCAHCGRIPGVCNCAEVADATDQNTKPTPPARPPRDTLKTWSAARAAGLRR